jgi:hypothetical protein
MECKKVSDYMAVNGRSVAKIMKGSDWYLREGAFLSMTGQMTKFTKLVPMMLRSVFKRVPGAESDYDCIVFPEATKVMIQAEGEYKLISGVRTVEIMKVGKPLLVVSK